MSVCAGTRVGVRHALEFLLHSRCSSAPASALAPDHPTRAYFIYWRRRRCRYALRLFIMCMKSFIACRNPAHQILLSSTSLQEFALHAPRTSLLSHNKEGIVSLLGPWWFFFNLHLKVVLDAACFQRVLRHPSPGPLARHSHPPLLTIRLPQSTTRSPHRSVSRIRPQASHTFCSISASAEKRKPGAAGRQDGDGAVRVCGALVGVARRGDSVREEGGRGRERDIQEIGGFDFLFVFERRLMSGATG